MWKNRAHGSPFAHNCDSTRKRCTKNRCESGRHTLNAFATSSSPPRARIVRQQGNRLQRSSYQVITIPAARCRHHCCRPLVRSKVQACARCKHPSDLYEKRRSSSWKRCAHGGKRNALKCAKLHKAAAEVTCKPQPSRMLAVVNHSGTSRKYLQALGLQGGERLGQHLERCGSPTFRSPRLRRLLQSWAGIKPTVKTHQYFFGFRQQADFSPKAPIITAGHNTLGPLVQKESTVISGEMRPPQQPQ